MTFVAVTTVCFNRWYSMKREDDWEGFKRNQSWLDGMMRNLFV
jgi:hypothetical protein